MPEALSKSTLTSTSERTGRDGLIGGLLIAGFVLIWMFVGFEAAFLLTIFLAWLVFRMDPRYLAGAAIVLLLAIPILLSQDLEPQAEQTAVYAFFLLCMVVVLQLTEYVRSQRTEKAVPTVPVRIRDHGAAVAKPHVATVATAADTIVTPPAIRPPQRRRRAIPRRSEKTSTGSAPDPALTLQERLEGVRVWRKRSPRVRSAFS
jgi:hypothetical protein